MSQSLLSGGGDVLDSSEVDPDDLPTPNSCTSSPSSPSLLAQVVDPEIDHVEDVLNTTSTSQSSAGGGGGLDCPICLQSCIHPVELPCRHIFCFLCIKGVVTQGGPQPRCAICRQDVPPHVLTHPTLKDIKQLFKDTSSGGFIWYYESRGGGWWEYDERTMQELERAHEAKLTTTQLLIAGHLYEIDFNQMIQFRTGNPNLYRRIKRDVPRTDKRGIAGIRLGQSQGRGGTSVKNSHPAGDGSSQGQGPSGFASTSLTTGAGAGYFSATGTGSRGGGGRARNGRNYSTSSSSIQSVIDSVANNRTGTGATSGGGMIHPSAGNGNSVTFFLPQDNNRVSPDQADTESGTEEGDDSLDDDEDMEFGEEDEESTEEEEYDDYDNAIRDGARAPTARSDRSTSSSNQFQTPPPDQSDGNGGSRSNSSFGVRTRSQSRGGRNSNNGGTGTSTTPVDNGRRSASRTSSRTSQQSGFPFSPTPGDQIVGGTNNGSGSGRLSTSTPTSPVGNIRVAVGGPQQLTPASGGNNNGGGGTSSTCIRIAPGLRITVDYDSSAIDDEVL